MARGWDQDESRLAEGITPRQFADLTMVTRLTATFSFLERLLAADFSSRGDLGAAAQSCGCA